MQVIDVPASAGFAWIKLSFGLFRAQPISWISLVSVWLLTTLGLFFVPLIGAAGGAGVNLLFIAHFQRMARGHFIVRRLERAHGRAEVQRAYDGPILTAMIAPPLLAPPISDAPISGASKRG